MQFLSLFVRRRRRRRRSSLLSLSVLSVHCPLEALRGQDAVPLEPVDAEAFYGPAEPEQVRPDPDLLVDDGGRAGVVRTLSEDDLLGDAHKISEVEVPRVGGHGLVHRIHLRLLNHVDPPGGEEVLSPAGKLVGLEDEPLGPQPLPVLGQAGLDDVLAEDVARVGVGVAAPVGRGHAVPGEVVAVDGGPVTVLVGVGGHFVCGRISRLGLLR